PTTHEVPPAMNLALRPRLPEHLDRPAAEALPDLVDPTREATVGRRSRVPRGLQRMLGPVLLLAAWQAASAAEVFDPRTVPSPSSVTEAFTDLVRSGELQEHLVASLGRVTQGLALGITIGVVLAVAAGLSRL